jgi:hypothetical protein
VRSIEAHRETETGMVRDRDREIINAVDALDQEQQQQNHEKQKYTTIAHEYEQRHPPQGL